MGKTRETGELTSANLITVNPSGNAINVGTAVTIYGGTVGIVSATAFYGDGSNLTGVVINSDVLDMMLFGC